MADFGCWALSPHPPLLPDEPLPSVTRAAGSIRLPWARSWLFFAAWLTRRRHGIRVGVVSLTSCFTVKQASPHESSRSAQPGCRKAQWLRSYKSSSRKDGLKPVNPVAGGLPRAGSCWTGNTDDRSSGSMSERRRQYAGAAQTSNMNLYRHIREAAESRLFAKYMQRFEQTWRYIAAGDGNANQAKQHAWLGTELFHELPQFGFQVGF